MKKLNSLYFLTDDYNIYNVVIAKKVYEILFEIIYKQPGFLSLQFIVISGLYDILYHNDSSDVLL